MRFACSGAVLSIKRASKPWGVKQAACACASPRCSPAYLVYFPHGALCSQVFVADASQRRTDELCIPLTGETGAVAFECPGDLLCP